jgi:hypothetical protein
MVPGPPDPRPGECERWELWVWICPVLVRVSSEVGRKKDFRLEIIMVGGWRRSGAGGGSLPPQDGHMGFYPERVGMGMAG